MNPNVHRVTGASGSEILQLGLVVREGNRWSQARLFVVHACAWLGTRSRFLRGVVVVGAAALLGLLPSFVGEAGAQSVPTAGTIPIPGYLHPVGPSRLLDTRTGLGAAGPVGAGKSIKLQVAGRGGVPAGASAVALNVTATQPSGSGYLTVYPSGGSLPYSLESQLRGRPDRPQLRHRQARKRWRCRDVQLVGSRSRSCRCGRLVRQPSRVRELGSCWSEPRILAGSRAPAGHA